MALIRDDSRDAFRVLVKRWQRPLYRFFALMGVERSSAEDCVQETFLRVFSYRDRYRSLKTGFRAFLFRVGRNVSTDLFRKAERRKCLVPLEGDVPEQDLSGELRDDRLDCEWALSRLPERLRAVVVLNVFEGLSYRETAQVLRIPVGTVKSRMHYALIQLRETLGAPTRI